LYAESIDTELIIRVDSFRLRPNAYPQYIHYRQTDRRETDDNGAIDAYSIAVIKKSVKNCVQYKPNNQC